MDVNHFLSQMQDLLRYQKDQLDALLQSQKDQVGALQAQLLDLARGVKEPQVGRPSTSDQLLAEGAPSNGVPTRVSNQDPA